MSVVTIEFSDVLTPSAAKSGGGKRTAQGVEVGPFKVETLHSLENATIDEGPVSPVMLGPGPFSEAQVTLSTYETGKQKTDVIFEFKVANDLATTDKMLLRIPREVVEPSADPVTCKIQIGDDADDDCSKVQSHQTDEFLELRMGLPKDIPISDRVRIIVSHFHNRIYSGPARSP